MQYASLAVAVLALLGACACGGSGEDRSARDARGRLPADLSVTVSPEGSAGRTERRRIRCASLGADATKPPCRRLGRLRPESLESVPARTACAQVYAGPATARVSGELRGVAVSASFNLTDACEIARWRRNQALLGPPPE